MINIQKIGNAIVIDFTDNDKYLHDGTIEVAPNELMIVIDESDMATFKKMSNGDTLFGQLINQIQIQGENVTKENIIDKFGAIGFSISGGGGAVSSVNGQTGEVVITATSLGAITKADADAAYAAKSDLNSKADISTVEALSTEVAANRTATTALTSKVNEDSEKIASLDTEMDNKANSADVPTNTQFNNLAGEVANKADKTSVYTKAEADEKFATKQDLNSKADFSTVDYLSADVQNNTNNINYLITQDSEHSQQISNLNTEIGNKQNTLVSGTNIKTVNGQSILGEGNIEISGGETITVDTELSETSENPVQNKVIAAALNGKQAAGDYALKSETATKSELASTNAELEHKADKTSVYTMQEVDNKLATKQATLIQGTNITLSEPDSEGKVTISASQPDITGLATKTEVTEGLATKLDTSVYNSEKANFALKSEIPDTSGLATKEEISDMETKTSAAATYQPKGDYAGQQEVTDLTANVTALQANKQDNLVSGTNIKTINGQSLLGEGNIEIQQSELPIASADTLGGVKVGTGLSINPEGVLSADSPEWNDISGKPEDIVNITERLASKLDTATYNSEKSSFATKDELNSKADASAIADMATQTWVQGQGYLTEVPSNYVTDSELTEGLAGKQDKGDYALKSDLNTLATKEELATKADASALSSKQDTLVSGTNIKTINGETILGAGDITIQAGGVGQNYYVGETLKGEIFNDYEGNQAKGQHSHAEGSITRAIGPYSHTEGWSTSAEGNYSHSEGEASRTGSMGDAAHAEGGHTVAGGQYSHTEGSYTVANGTNTHAEGDHTKTTNNAEHSQGKYNKSNTGATDDLKTIHSIGIGVDTAGRKNAQEVMTNGDHYIIGIGGYDGTNPEAAQTLQEVVNSGGSSITVDTAMSDTSENAVQNKVIKKYIDDLVGNILTQLQEINGTN